MLTLEMKKAYIALLNDTGNDIDITLHMNTKQNNIRIDRALNAMKDLTAILKTVVAAS
jgi:hypothetical protein